MLGTLLATRAGEALSALNRKIVDKSGQDDNKWWSYGAPMRLSPFGDKLREELILQHFTPSLRIPFPKKRRGK